MVDVARRAEYERRPAHSRAAATAAATSSTSASVSVRQSSSSLPSRTMPTTGGSPARSGAASSSSSAQAKLAISASGSAPPPTRATVLLDARRRCARRVARRGPGRPRAAPRACAGPGSRRVRARGRGRAQACPRARRASACRRAAPAGADAGAVARPGRRGRRRCPPAARRAACRRRSRRGARRPRGCRGRAARPASSPSAPEPRSSTSARPRRSASCASSASGGCSVKPTIRKFDWWTRSSARGVVADRALVVGDPRAVRRPDLDEAGAASARGRRECGSRRRSRRAPRARRRPRRPSASAASASSTAAALLLTTRAASAPVRSQRHRRGGTGASRGLRPRGRTRGSSSRGRPRRRAPGPPSASGARPRFVCTTTPVALMTREVADCSDRRELGLDAVGGIARLDARPGSPRARGRAAGRHASSTGGRPWSLDERRHALVGEQAIDRREVSQPLLHGQMVERSRPAMIPARDRELRHAQPRGLSAGRSPDRRAAGSRRARPRRGGRAGVDCRCRSRRCRSRDRRSRSSWSGRRSGRCSASRACSCTSLSGSRGRRSTRTEPRAGTTFLGPTGGYLIGFVVAAAVTGMLAERKWDRKFPSSLAAMLTGNVLIYVPGLIWLAAELDTNLEDDARGRSVPVRDRRPDQAVPGGGAPAAGLEGRQEGTWSGARLRGRVTSPPIHSSPPS